MNQNVCVGGVLTYRLRRVMDFLRPRLSNRVLQHDGWIVFRLPQHGITSAITDAANVLSLGYWSARNVEARCSKRSHRVGLTLRSANSNSNLWEVRLGLGPTRWWMLILPGQKTPGTNANLS